MSRARPGCASFGVAVLLWLFPAPVSAVPPIGSFEIQLSLDQSIWLVGNQDAAAAFCQLVLGQVDTVESCEFATHLDGRGRISGDAALSGWDDGSFVTLEGVVRGRRNDDERTGLTEISYAVDLEGEASDGGVAIPRKGTLEFNFFISGRGGTIVTFTSRWCVGSADCVEHFGAFPPWIQHGGGWTLALEIGDGGDGDLVGVARADFGDGSACLYSVRGSYDARRDLARLAFVPTTPECDDTRLRLDEIRMPEDALTARLRYALFGSRGDLIVESSAGE